jgi:hypothetical protein
VPKQFAATFEVGEKVKVSVGLEAEFEADEER